ncbi:MAG: polymer-forming cytoskeletal protein [Lentimicrobiaceae bacterium]|nr:polymer-forming cytoskeletal protein [Lentimicrobiaceae bacterium]
MKKIYTIAILLSMGITQIYAQCYQCDSTTKAFTIGTNNIATGQNAFAGGNESFAPANNSFAFGNGSQVLGLNGIALGNNAKVSNFADGIAIGSFATSNAANSLVFGMGTSGSPLVNNKPNSIMFGVNNKPSLTIFKPTNADRGYLGIGTEEPKEMAHVVGKLLIERTNEVASSLQFKHPSTRGTGPGPDEPQLAPSYWDIYSDAGGLKFNTIAPNGTSSQSMIISGSGSVGIGIAVPKAKLHVVQNILSDGNITALDKFVLAPDHNSTSGYWEISRTNTGLNYGYMDGTLQNVFFMGNNGKIGMGTNTPAEKWQVVNGNILISKNPASTSSGSVIFKLNSAHENAWGIEYINSTAEGSGFNFWNNKDIGVIDNVYQKYSILFLSDGKDGNVGIGTKSPGAKLDVSGTVKASAANVTGTITGNALTINRNADIAGTITGNALTINRNADIAGTITGNALTIDNDATIAGAITGNALTIDTDATITGTLSANTLSAKGANIDGKIKTKAIEVTLEDWPDFVFEDDYNLLPLKEVEQYIKQNGHLPEIPSAKEVEENGVNLGEMQSKLLMKIEELTLYILDLQKQIDELKK